MMNRVFLRKKKKENAGVAHTDLAQWPEKLDKTLKPSKTLKERCHISPIFFK